VDAVFHVAAKADFWGHPDDFYRANVRGTEVLLTASQAQGVGKFIYTSTPSVVFGGRDICGVDESAPYPAWYLGLYPETKAIAEQTVLANNGVNGQATCSLRPHLVYGPRDRHIVPILIERARAGRLTRIGDTDPIVDVTYVVNAAAAHLQACDALTPDSPVAGSAYFISDGEPVYMWDWIDDLLSRLGVAYALQQKPYALAMAAASLMEAAWTLAPLRGAPPLTRFMVANFATSHYYDIAAARRDFGYAPTITGDTAMKLTVGYFLANPALD
jgi:nucleoside-diphosphate-sugar epimerase